LFIFVLSDHHPMCGVDEFGGRPVAGRRGGVSSSLRVFEFFGCFFLKAETPLISSK
jgi:hypothetical protein